MSDPISPAPSPEGAPQPFNYLDSQRFEAEQKFCAYVAQIDWSFGKTKQQQTYHCFLRAASLGVDPNFAREEIVKRIVASGGLLDPNKIQRQQQRAVEFITGQAAEEGQRLPKAPRPTFSPETLARVAGNIELPDPCAALRAASPIPTTAVTPASFLDHIYQPGEKVVVFTTPLSQGQCIYEVGTGNHDGVPSAAGDGVWFLVQPVDGKSHFNPREQKSSRRSEEAVTSWRYLLLESDLADTNDWIRALVQLPLPISAIYSSGGRSIHGLVRVDAATKAEWDTFKRAIEPVVVALGADKGALSAVRLSRLPQCWRGNRQQELLYLDPEANGQPITKRLVGHRHD